MNAFETSDLLRKAALALPLVLVAWSTWAAGAEDEGGWTMGELRAAKVDAAEPVIAATADELERLRAAWATEGKAHDALAERFGRTGVLLEQGPDIPPAPGQHNQWYQCEACQIALETVDEHHQKCPKCEKVYSGFPFDNCLYGRRHFKTFYRMDDAAWAWATTRDERYAKFAREAMLAYAERYLQWPLVTASVGDESVDVSKLPRDDWRYTSAGHIWEQTLNESMGMIYLIKTYDLTRDAPCLSDEDRRTIREKLIRPMAENIAKNPHGKSNWQTWHNAALMWAGAALGDEAMIRRAAADPEHGFAFQMNASVSEEGMWYENSWGYHYYTLLAMTHLAEGGRRIGLDLYGHPSLRKMYTLAFDYAMTDGSLPRFGDAVQSSPYSRLNEFAYAAYRDERIRGYLATGPTFDSIMLGREPGRVDPDIPAVSQVFESAGHAILRTDGPGKLSAAMTFGPYGGFHGHLDKLSFVLFGHGREIAVDPGRAKSQAYRLPIHREWYKATAGHNAVLVDGKGQEPSDGKLLVFKATPSYAAVVADAGEAAFDGVRHRRLLLLTPDRLVIVDDLKAEDEKVHTYDWLSHLKVPLSSYAPSDDAELGDGSPGYAYIHDVAARKVGAASTPYGGDITDGGKFDMPLMLHVDEGDVLFRGTGPFRSVEDRVPMVIWRRKASSTVFVASIGFEGKQAQDITGFGMAVDRGRLRLYLYSRAKPEYPLINFGTGDDWITQFTVRDAEGKIVLDTMGDR